VEEEDGKGSEPKLDRPQGTSTLSDSQYAVLPHGGTLQGWTPEEKEELDDLVRHMLHSRRARFKRSMKGFRQYIRRRKSALQSAIELFRLTKLRSSGTVHNSLCYLDYAIRRGLGAFPHRLDISRLEGVLHYKRRR
jgi:hypothetical protein